MANKKPKVTVVTPAGQLIWPNLNTPDTKFDSAGKYTARIAFDADADLSKLREMVEAMRDEFYAEKVEELKAKGKAGVVKKLVVVDPFTAEEDEEGEETGRIIINPGMKASGIYKSGPKQGRPWKAKPDIFSANGTKLKNPPLIGSGTTAKLSLELFPYYAAADKKIGVSFRLQAAQILTLVSFGERDAGGYGFGEEEGDDIEDREDEGNTPFDGSDDDDDDDDDL